MPFSGILLTPMVGTTVSPSEEDELVAAGSSVLFALSASVSTGLVLVLVEVLAFEGQKEWKQRLTRSLFFAWWGLEYIGAFFCTSFVVSKSLKQNGLRA